MIRMVCCQHKILAVLISGPCCLHTCACLEFSKLSCIAAWTEEYINSMGGVAAMGGPMISSMQTVSHHNPARVRMSRRPMYMSRWSDRQVLLENDTACHGLTGCTEE